MTITPDRLALLEQIHLDDGSHSDFDDGHCAMEIVSWLADEGFTDAPQCASPVLRRYTIALNDRWNDERRQTLKPYLPRMVGTGGDGKDPARERIAAEYVARLLGPWLRLAGLDQEADALEAADCTDVDEVRRLARAARDAAWALRHQRAKVKEHLADRSVAAADADAAAVAAAVAVAVADADAAAVAVADAVAAAVAVAVADADPWGKGYSAAYKAARAYYEQHPLPITQEVAELAATQRGVALELLDKMIDPQAAA